MKLLVLLKIMKYKHRTYAQGDSYVLQNIR